MFIAYTDNYERLLATPEAPTTVGMWIEPRYRANHIHERAMKDLPMTVRSIALSIGLDIAPLEEAWRAHRDRYRFHVDIDEVDRESNLIAAERYQRFLIAALDVLVARVRPFFGAWGHVPSAGGEAVRVPGFQWMPEQAILKTLLDRPDGMVDVIAAWMVVMAATPEEVDEAVQRRSVALSLQPERIREVEATVDQIVELWYLPPRGHRRLEDVELLVVRLELPVIPDPNQPEQSPIVAAITRPRANGYGHVTVLGGPQDGEQLGRFPCSGDIYTIATRGAIGQLNKTGTLPSIDTTDGPEVDGGH